jgi:uncharacterized iron-regulated protein
MKTMRILLLLTLLPFAFTLQAQILDTSHYRIWSVARGMEVTPEQIARDMASADILLFGEEHNDSVTHFLQARMLEAMHAQFGDALALSMEMFERDVQVVMDEYLRDAIQEKHFRKDARAWSNYRDYRPMVEFAKANRLEVICANAASRYTNLAGRKGQDALRTLPIGSRKHFAPIPYRTAQGGYLDKLHGFMGGHAPAATDSAKATPPPAMAMGGFDLVTAQSLWDATMAWSIAEYLQRRPNRQKKVLHLNGRFHSDEYFGVFTQLQHYAPKKRVLVISAGSDEAFPNIDWTKHKHLGDYIIITDPAVPRTYN